MACMNEYKIGVTLHKGGWARPNLSTSRLATYASGTCHQTEVHLKNSFSTTAKKTHLSVKKVRHGKAYVLVMYILCHNGRMSMPL